ncbi:DJ-1/PfpI family protein [Marinigracilibium pacificum]|uniref:DJ-1/PfpI family protein n=1 Tax=Marinigracilibium pacificum TaxID=2729599 RepID=A0A848J340_9BACT|nr:DJ-1/PfpI family protein [Marinigracilibium pacificum]NMM50141.1 DJ-1/PfpI family protein [Marinigracilibium pacificum]
MKITVGFFIYDNMELMDFAGPWEVLSVAAELVEESHELKLFSFAEYDRQINTVNGVSIIPDFVIDNKPDLDVLIFPGGNGSKRIISNDRLLSDLAKASSSAKITATVCSGARIAATLGLLKGKKFTTHYSVFDDVIKIEPTAEPDFDNRYVREGNVLTSAGVSAGIDMSLFLVSVIFDDETAEKTARFIEYPYFTFKS